MKYRFENSLVSLFLLWLISVGVMEMGHTDQIQIGYSVQQIVSTCFQLGIALTSWLFLSMNGFGYKVGKLSIYCAFSSFSLMGYMNEICFLFRRAIY